MYTLTLSRDERRAVEWVGNRYWNGDEFRFILMDCINHGSEWDDAGPVTFFVDEFQAWNILDLSRSDGWTCFSPAFVDKLELFLEKIV